MRVAPRGSLHEGVADLFNTDVRSILMVLLGFHSYRKDVYMDEKLLDELKVRVLIDVIEHGAVI